jgi:hypothetical protein
MAARLGLRAFTEAQCHRESKEPMKMNRRSVTGNYLQTLLLPVLTLTALSLAPRFMHSGAASSPANSAGLNAPDSQTGEVASTSQHSVLHGVIAGLIASESHGREAMTTGPAWRQAAPFDREFQNILKEAYKARQQRQSPPFWKLLWSYLTKSDPVRDTLADEPLLGREFEEGFLMDLDAFVARERLAAFQALSANIIAMEQSAPSDSSTDLETSLVPVSVKHGEYVANPDADSASLVVAGTSANGSSPSNPTVPADWSSLPSNPPPAGSSFSSTNGNFSGNKLPDLWNPQNFPAAPNWQNYAPQPRTVSPTFLGHSHGGAPITVNMPAAPTVSLPSPTVPASVPASVTSSYGASGATLSSSQASGATVSGGTISLGTSIHTELATPVQGSSGQSSGVTPLVSSIVQTIYVTNGNGPGGTGFVGQYNGVTSGTPISAFAPTPTPGGTLLGVAIGFPGGAPVIYYADETNSTVRAVSATTGVAFAGFTTITGFTSGSPDGLAVAGNTLYVANGNNSTVQAYNATTGSQISFTPTSASLNFPYCLATTWVPQVNAEVLFVGDVGSSKLLAFNASTGAAVPFNAPTVESPSDIAIAGNVLYVADDAFETVTAYNLTNGLTSVSALAGFTTINVGALNSGHGDVTGISAVNGDLYVEDDNGDTVTEWNALTGAQIAYTSPTGLDSPDFIVAVPEPASAGLLAFGACALLGRRRRRKA